MRTLLVAVALCLPAARAHAHEVRPAYLELREAGDTWDVLFKVPARGSEKRMALRLRLPEDCERTGPVRTEFTGVAFVDRYAIRHPDDLSGSEIYIEGLSTTLTDVLVRVEREDGSTQVVRLTPDAPSFVVQTAPGWLQVAWIYLDLGIEHILLGIDHLFFVLTLLFLVRGRRLLVQTITAFTVAHSLTLAAATLGFLYVPQQPVEAVIALSIVYVAAEALRPNDGQSLAQRRPWVVAFLFGLLHGLGFAGALTEIGLPQSAVPLSLLFFNVGVEVGQLLFVVAALCLLAAARRVGVKRAGALLWTRRAVVYAIGSMAAFWAVERVAGFA